MWLNTKFEAAGFRFSDDPGGGTPPPAAPEAPKPDDWKMEDLPPAVQEYIRGLRKSEGDTRTEAKKKLDEADRLRQEAENKRLAEEKKWQELAENHAAKLREIQPLAEQGQRIQEAFMSSLKKRMDALPDYMKALAEKITDPVILSGWLDEHADKLVPRTAPGQDGGPRGDGGTATKLSDEELKMARKMGLSPEEYAKYKP